MMMNLRASADFVEPFGICYGCGDFVMWNLDETLFLMRLWLFVIVCGGLQSWLWWFASWLWWF
jgi:hypothetical protein